MNNDGYELDMVNVERCLPRLECWIKEEDVILEDLKESLLSINELYKSNNSSQMKIYNNKFKECINTISLNNKKVYDELENAVLFHNRVKQQLLEKSDINE